MSKILFVVPPFFGHISPTLSVGASLIAKGHEVKWVGLIPLNDSHIPEGGEYIVPSEELAAHQEEITHILKRQDEGPFCSRLEVIKLGLEETFIPIARMMMEGLGRIVDSFQPDVIINDCIAFAGALCAHLKGIPCITTTPVPPDVMDGMELAPKIMEWQKNLIATFQQEVGICEQGVFIHSHQLNIVFTSQEFAHIQQPVPSMQFVGPVAGRPSHSTFDWERFDEATTPKIFVSIGTLLVDIRKAFFEKMIAAFAESPLTIIAATDPIIIDEWPDNFIVQGYVPQTELMKKVDAVICHGGFNTVNDTFMNGLPMLIIPIAYDHFHTASLIEQAGCGIKIRYKRLRIDELRSSLSQLLDQPRYRTAALRIKETFIQAGGNKKAVQLIEDFMHSTVKEAYQ